MSAARDFWQTVHERFDPEEPARDHGWRAERPRSPRRDIITALNRPFGGPPHYLLIGTVGTGKSTELLALAEEQIERRVVVVVDVRRHFVESVRDPEALEHVQPWELLLLVGLAVYSAGREILGEDWAAAHLDQFKTSLEACAAGSQDEGDTPSVDIPALASALAVTIGGPVGGLAGAGLKAFGSMVKAARWSFRLGRRSRTLPDQDSRVIDLANAVNGFIGTIQQQYTGLLVVVDGLDRISNPSTVRNLFLESSLLGGLVCASIVAGPIVLRRRGMASRVRKFATRVLANAPVLDHDCPSKPGQGIDFLYEVYQRRVYDLTGASIPDPLVRKLAYYAGGRGRDFVHLVRGVAARAWDRALSEADDTAVDEAIDERRRLLELGLNKKDIEILRSVADDPEHRLPDDERVGALLDNFCLLPFPNRSEWYFPHPLLTLELVKLPRG